jgi:hypothetical protein
MVWTSTDKDYEVFERGAGESLTPIYSPDTNNTTSGTISNVYSARNLIGATLTSDGNISTLGGPVTSNLKYNAVWAEDMATGGPLYDIIDAGYRPEAFVTGATEMLDEDGDDVMGEYIGWRQIDVTRPPSGVDSSGNFDPNSGWYNPYDKFDLFHTEKERGYWVYVTDTDNNTITVTTSGGSNGFSGKVVRHFQNDINDTDNPGVGTVYNHPDRTTTVTVGGLYDYYANMGYSQPSYIANVIATIAGQSIPMFPGASDQFTMELSKYEMLYPAQFAQGSDYTTDITVTDGVGYSATGSLTYDFTPPSTPEVTWSGATLEANSTNANYIKVFEGNVSDHHVWQAVTQGASVASTTAGYRLLTTGTGSTLSYNPSGSSVLSHPNDQTGTTSYYYDLRVIGVDGSDNTDSQWSNMMRTYFVPALIADSSSRSAHVVSAASTAYDKYPCTYTITGSDDGNYTDESNNSIDSGVQVKAATSGTTVTVAYQHRAIQLDEALVLGMNIGTNDGIIGTILFMPQYTGEVFYVYYDDGAGNTALYYGTFPSDNSNLDEANYYNFDSKGLTTGGEVPTVTGQSIMQLSKECQ